MKTVILTLYALGAAGLALVAWLAHRDAAAQRSAATGASEYPEVVAGTDGAASSRRQRVPRFSDIAGFVMAYRVGRVPVGRIAVLGSWWWVGWHFFAR
ncbi:MAG: hypothetical protein IRY85_12695 [Micromonosporaceae bacterium]|nr:hypothetical protein [Micromonosporaceae bacterium]